MPATSAERSLAAHEAATGLTPVPAVSSEEKCWEIVAPLGNVLDHSVGSV